MARDGSDAKSAAQRGRIPQAGALNGPSITSTGCGHSGQLSWTYLMGQQGGSAVTEPWLAQAGREQHSQQAGGPQAVTLTGRDLAF